jgi:hypothetical protein
MKGGVFADAALFSSEAPPYRRRLFGVHGVA